MKKYSIVTLIPTLFYVGYLPKMPGTWGSIFAFLILFVPKSLFFPVLLISFIISFLISIPMISKMESSLGSDPSIVVIDEVLGMWFIFFFDFIVDDKVFLILSLILFRIIDIYKPLYINKINDKKGAIYVILDDILASVYTIALLFILKVILEHFNF